MNMLFAAALFFLLVQLIALIQTIRVKDLTGRDAWMGVQLIALIGCQGSLLLMSFLGW